MRFVIYLFGLACGVAATLAYAMFANDRPEPVARPLPEDPAITVILGEPFLTGMLRRAALGQPGVATAPSALRVQFRDDTIVVTADIAVVGQRTEGTAILRPILRDGKLRMEVVETTLGAMPLPSLDQTIEAQINERLGSLLTGMPVTFTGVAVDRARGLVVTCRLDLDKLGIEATAVGAADGSR